MRYTTFKQLVLLIGMMLPTAWCDAIGTNSIDGYSHIHVKQGNVQGVPKGSTIQASINGHLLVVVFSENLGQVAVEVSTTTGTMVDYTSTITPNGIQIYIPNIGDYIVTFTLSNGDEYYGEFTITD